MPLKEELSSVMVDSIERVHFHTFSRFVLDLKTMIMLKANRRCFRRLMSLNK